MKAIVKTLLMSVVGIAAFGSCAMAADIIEAPPVYEPVPEVVPVEIGSGWYLRGDVSYDFESKFGGKYRTYADPTGCDSCGSGYATQDYDEWKIDNGADFGVGAGYQFTDYFRGDLTAHYWEHDVNGKDEGADCNGLCGSTESSSARTWELMANAYVDVGTFAGITPYVGAGVGAANVKYDDFKSKNYCEDPSACSDDSFAGESDWRFAYALMAGVSYDLTKALKLDVGYRYVDVDGGQMFGKNKAGGVVGGDDDGFDRHTIQAGVRYSLF